MQTSVTLKDVARAAGVSVSTVSRALSDGGVCKPATRKRLGRLAKKMGYEPSPLASSLTTNSTKLIGVVVDNFENPFFMSVFDRFTSELQAKGYGCLIVSITGDSDPDQAAAMLVLYNVDGVFVASSTLPELFLTAIQHKGIPIVHTFGRDTPKRMTSVVGVNNVYCGELAAQELFDTGYRRVALLGGPECATSTLDRTVGFEKRCLDLGVELAATEYALAYTYGAGQAAMSRLLGKKQTFEAVFCGDDLLCMAAMDLARSRNLKVPDDIGFIGVNDMMIAEWDRRRTCGS